MFQGFERISGQFISPDIEKEHGEFDRIAKEMNLDPDVLVFLAKDEGRLVELGKEMWSNLENTDSFDIEKDEWHKVEDHSVHNKRDWQSLREKMNNRQSLDAPIIMKYEGRYHLVSGNTRLMVARALGIVPQVLLFEYIHDRTDEQS